MSLLRVRLSFCRMPVEPKNCWFLVDTSVCRVVADLEYLIRERFNLRKLTHGGAIDLLLDEFLLPSQEKIEIIRDHDIIRVQESLLNIQSNGTSEHPRAAKRKGNLVEAQSLKRQHLQVSTDDEEEEETSPTQAKPQRKSIDKGKDGKKERSKKLSAKNGPKNDKIPAPDKAGRKDDMNVIKHNRKEKHLNKDTSKKGIGPEVGHDTVKKTMKNPSKVDTRLEHRPKAGSSASVTFTECQSDFGPSNKGQINGPNIVHQHNGNGGNVWTVAASQPSATSTNRSPSVAVQPMRNSQTTPRNVNNMRSVGCHNRAVENRSQLSRNQIGKQQSQVPPRIPIRQASPNSSTHVRFDSDDDVNDQQGPEVKGQEDERSGISPRAPCPLGTGSALPYNPTSAAWFGGEMQTSQNGAAQLSVPRQQRSAEVGSAPALLAPGQEHQLENSKSQTSEKVSMDYSQFDALHGPPRTGDRIAYKVLELSASYTPEISVYKEGTVLDYDSKSGTVYVELTIESLKKSQGDGNVSKKFELIYEEPEEVEENVEIPVSEEERKVAVLWSAMREPRLLSSNGTTAS